MLPRVFISSTIADLLHLREAIRDLVRELGYEPVMSEYGGIGYLPSQSAVDSCYRESQQCDFGILIIGKRYGSTQENGLSVTHNELRAMIERRIPIITLVERDVLTYRKMFDVNTGGKTLTVPGVENPEATFSLISEVVNRAVNNGIGEFTQALDAREYVKKQLAHWFADLLKGHHDPIKADIRDVLAELMALRNEISVKKSDPKSNQFLRLSRLLLEDKMRYYKELSTKLHGTLEAAITSIMECPTFRQVIEDAGWKLEVVEDDSGGADYGFNKSKSEMLFCSRWIGPNSSPGPTEYISWYYGDVSKNLTFEKRGFKEFEALHLSLRASVLD